MEFVLGRDQRFDDSDSRHWIQTWISDSSRFEARVRATSSPEVFGSNILFFQFILEPHSPSSSSHSGQDSLSVSRICDIVCIVYHQDFYYG